MKYELFILVLIVFINASAHEVFDPESRIIPKKQFYSEPVKKIYFYINFISARYGKKFADIEVQKEFEKQKWYKINESYDDSLLNKIDKQNIKNLTKIYKSLSDHIKQLKSLNSEITWEKPVNFIENDPTQKCVFTVIKQSKGFKVKFRFQNKDGIYYKNEYDILLTDFGNEWNGYPFDGAYEAIAKNFEFINIEFYPDERTEMSVMQWYEQERKLNSKQAKKKYSQIEKSILKFKGEAFFTGNMNDTLFPPEYIYLKEERSFVLVYTP